jgi:ribonuclease HI
MERYALFLLGACLSTGARYTDCENYSQRGHAAYRQAYRYAFTITGTACCAYFDRGGYTRKGVCNISARDREGSGIALVLASVSVARSGEIVRARAAASCGTKHERLSGEQSAHGPAGAGVCWGGRSRHNLSARVPGRQTNNSAELFAIAEAVRIARPDRALRIFTDSQFAIREVCHYAHKRSAEGWTGPTGTSLRQVVALLQRRRLPVRFTYIEAHAGHENNEIADRLAKAGCALDLPTEEPRAIPVLPRSQIPPQGQPKISTALPRIPERKSEQPSRLHAHDDDDDDDGPAHRGRTDERRLRQRNEQRLHDAAKAGEADLWKLLRDWLDAQPTAPAVESGALHASLPARMTQQPRDHEHFDNDHLAQMATLARAIPARTTDRTGDSAIFSRPFTVQDIERLKAHIKRHRAGSARGADDVAYTEILQIPNDELCALFNACVKHGGVPGVWLTTLIIGILKPRKAADNPEHYRLIAFQSCLLKCLTLLFDFRMREWADAYGILPDSQNGFRTGYRTNNNAFVLRCAIDRARAGNQTLYTAFVDLKNAFPSTDLPTLWAKLYARGVSGPLFDWVRALYSDMRYTTSLGGTYSELFASDIGVMTGDTASPGLFLVFLADFTLPDDPGDICLAGLPISHLEQADDMVLFSTTPQGLQRKINALFQWCRRNGLIISVDKTMCAVFAKPPRIISIFTVGHNALPNTTEYTYVGIVFRSDARYTPG